MTDRKPRRTRADSTGNLVRIAQGAAGEIPPPAHISLPEEALPQWQNIIGEKAKCDWSRHELDVAAFLAWTMASLEAQHRLVRQEGMLIEATRGMPRQNPRNRVVANLTRQVVAMRRSLGLHALGGRGEDVARRTLANRAIERGLTDHDSLS